MRYVNTISLQTGHFRTADEFTHPTRHADALRLAGAWKAFRISAGIHGSPRFWKRLQERELGRAQRELPRETAERAWQEGLAESLDAAVAWVFSQSPRN